MSLSDRLRRMKDEGAEPGIGVLPPSISSDELKNITLPGWDRVGEFLYARDLKEGPRFGPRIASRLTWTEFDTRRLCFVDTETTGLSTGAGSIAFLFGAGRIVGSEFRVGQVFLSDFPGEASFLERVATLIPADPIYVSYNGSSFDLPLLRSRCGMQGLRFPPGESLDLLHVSRRFWQSRIGACGLKDVEREVLGEIRHGDVEGAEIPDRYFRFLRTGDTGLLEEVFKHHHRDISTLQRLMAHCETVLREPAGELFDLHRVGRWLLGRGDEEGRSLLQLSFERGNLASGFELARFLRRSGAIGEAVSLWDRIWNENGDPASGVEIAKHREHRLRDFRGAVEIVELLQDDPKTETARGNAPFSSESLSHRRRRLLRRIERQNRGNIKAGSTKSRTRPG